MNPVLLKRRTLKRIAMDIKKFIPFFQEIDETPENYPGRFSFWIPNSRAFRRWPSFPKAARPESGRAAGGRGLDYESCMRSGLGEAIELSSCCAWGDEALSVATPEELGHEAIPPGPLLGFSQSQIAHRTNWNSSKLGQFDWQPPEANPRRPIAWMEGWDAVSGDLRLVPADYVLIGRRSRGDPHSTGVANTSGCAAAETAENAELRALLELIERDAVGRWWYGSRRRPVVSIEVLKNQVSLHAFIRKRERQTRLIDVTTDLNIPAIAAVSWEKDGQNVAMGFGARLTYQEAAMHAVVELLQTEIGLIQRELSGEAYIFDWKSSISANDISFDETVTTNCFDTSLTNSVETQRDRCLESLGNADCTVTFVDQSRPEFEVPVVRAIVPELCNDKPRWGRQRLLAPDARDLGPKPIGSVDGTPPNTFPLLV